MRARARRILVSLLATSLLGPGCATKMGSRSLPEVRASYNEAIAASADQQMLLNLVRLRYLHSMTFLQLSSVVTQYSLSTDLGVSANYNAGTGGGPVPVGSVGGSTGVAVSERPTITYTPLQGEQFVRRLAMPMTPEHIVMLLQVGWGADLVLDLCVQQINDLHAPFTSSRAEDGDFQRLAELMRTIQYGHELSIEESERGTVLAVRPLGDAELSPEATEALALLGLAPEIMEFPVTPKRAPRMPGTIAVRGRSLLSTMFYLSQGVEIPDGDEAAREIGAPTPIPRPLLHVRTSPRAPKDAYVAVPYRGHWFYLDEHDLESKRTFVLLGFLFMLTAAPSAGGPVLTVGAGGA